VPALEVYPVTHRLVLLLVLGAASAATAKVPPCPPGRYLAAAPLVEGVAESVAVEVAEPRLLSIDGACAPKPGTRKGTRKGTKVGAAWPACGALRKVRLAARIDPDCFTMRGRLRARRMPARAFVATLSTCGDGRFDAGGEQCETSARCGVGQYCTAGCACADIPFTLALAPDALTVVQGESASTEVRVTRQAGFTEAIAVTVLGLPAGGRRPLPSPRGRRRGRSCSTLPWAARRARRRWS
jgi:hypothetical protein